MIAKLRNISKNINPFGGINFVVHSIRKNNIPKLIDKYLGKRVKQATYQYSDVILSWIYANFCGADRLEDISDMKKHFSDMPNAKCPSSDRIAFIFKRFCTENIKVKNSDNCYYNINKPFNKLLLDASLKLKLLNTNANYTLDYDVVVIPTEKHDCEYTYKKYKGYSPAVCFINQIPVSVEGRSGNTAPAADMKRSLKFSLDLLKEKNIHTNRLRSDAAAYQKSVIEYIDGKGMEFFIRAVNSPRLYKGIEFFNWQKVEINSVPYELTSVNYTPFDGKKSYRIVVSRRLDVQKADKNNFTDDNSIYRTIITNNYSMSDREVVEFYNQRGAIEKNFDMLLNDFNWKRMPFSFLAQNTVFWLIGALASILYRHTIITFSKKIDFIKSNFRLKTFIFKFISVAAYWQKDELWLYTDKDYGGAMDG